MRLDKTQRQQLYDALLKAFPTPAKLRKMVGLGLNQNLDAIATGENLSDIVYKLITDAEAKGLLTELLESACNPDWGNPENPQLKAFCDCSKKEPAVTKQSHRLLNPCNFDLTQIIDHCLDKLLFDQQKTLGLAIPCDDDAFQENFCHRLKYELGKTNIQIQRPLTLSPRFTSTQTAVNAISRYKEILKYSDVICPVRIQVFDPNSPISEEFWQKLTAAFNTNCQHRLIVIMLGSEDSIFPNSVIKLNPPEFKKLHVHKWTVAVTRSLEWEEQFTDVWQQKMITECLTDDSPDGILDIRFVYEHLDYATKLLKKNLSAEAFLQAIEDKIQAYV